MKVRFKFPAIAKGSLLKVQTQLFLAAEPRVRHTNGPEQAESLASKPERMLTALITRLRKAPLTLSP